MKKINKVPQYLRQFVCAGGMVVAGSSDSESKKFGEIKVSEGTVVTVISNDRGGRNWNCSIGGDFLFTGGKPTMHILAGGQKEWDAIVERMTEALQDETSDKENAESSEYSEDSGFGQWS